MHHQVIEKGKGRREKEEGKVVRKRKVKLKIKSFAARGIKHYTGQIFICIFQDKSIDSIVIISINVLHT